MASSSVSITKTLSALAAACFLGAFCAAPASAQIAVDLVCTDCVDGSEIQDGTLGNGDLADNAVDGAKVVDDSLTGADISGLAGIDINTASVPSTDLSDEAGMDSDFDGIAAITSNDSAVISVALTAPSSGFVTVVASGAFDYAGTDTIARCSIITSGVTIDPSNNVKATLSAAADFVPFSAVRSFAVSARTTKYKLVCDILAAAGSAFVDDMNISAMFFPTAY